LSRPSRNQFNRIWDNIPFIASNCKKMNMIRSDCIIQYHQSVALFCFIQPLKPSTSILGKIQQKLSLMTSVGDVPYLPGYIMSLGSRHYVICLYCPFHPQKERYRPKCWRCCGHIPLDIKKLTWSDPDSDPRFSYEFYAINQFHLRRSVTVSLLNRSVGERRSRYNNALFSSANHGIPEITNLGT